MSREKQIEEMAKIIRGYWKDKCPNNGCNNYIEYAIAQHLYNTGYRKQSEGEWGFDGMSWTCSECGEYATKGIKTDFCPNCGAKMKGGAE